MSRLTYHPIKHQILISFLLFLLLFISYFIFKQGIADFFLLDDYSNLDAFSSGIKTTEDIKNYLFDARWSGSRIISRLSFLLNDNQWPSYAASFKLTNIYIHLLTSLFIFLLAQQILSLFYKTAEVSNYAALMVAAIWLLHPLNTSTVLYVVQRMTQLSALFLFSGLTIYFKGRLVAFKRPLKGFFLMSLGVGLFGLLSILSKENGVLILLFILVLEYSIFSAKKIQKPLRYWQTWLTVFIYIPLSIIIIYFLLSIESYQNTYTSMRNFDLTERLLTQSSVLLNYLYYLFIPHLNGLGVFHDDFPVTKNLFQNTEAILSTLSIIFLLTIGFFCKKKYPLLSFSILWFFAGHFLESTFLPLELYFEHRNYIPMFGPIIGIVYYLFLYLDKHSQHSKAQFLVGLFSLTVLSSIALLQLTNTKTWSNYLVLTSTWYNEHPRSIRAANEMIPIMLISEKKPDKALEAIDQTLNLDKKNIFMLLYKAQVLCKYKKQMIDLEKLYSVAATGTFNYGITPLVEKILIDIQQQTCNNLQPLHLVQFLHYLSQNKSYQHNKYHYHSIFNTLSKLYISIGDLNNAIAMLDKAYLYHSVDSIPYSQALLLYSAGLFKESQQFLEKAYNAPIKRQAQKSLDELNAQFLKKTANKNIGK